MIRSELLAVLAGFAGVTGAFATVEWGLTGPDKSAAGRFAKVFADQTDSVAAKNPSPSAYVFHCGEDDFVKGLKLDLGALHPYGYVLAKRGNDIAFAGRTRTGTAYAAFDFLKRFTGYRSFGGKLGEIVPKVSSLDLPESFTYREQPDVLSVYIAGTDGANGAFTRNSRQTCIATHAMSSMVTKDLYDAHPEYFALIDGIRTKPGTGPCNPCISNPDMPELFRAYARRYFAKKPDAIGLPLGVNDGGGDCDCERCVAIWKKHGNQYVEFYNKAAKILAEEFPGKYLAFIAYSLRCSHAPKDGLRMEPNILVEVTGMADTYDDWQKAGVKNFGTYEYLYGLNTTRMAPACYTHVVADYLRRQMRKYGMKTFWEEYYCHAPLFDGGRQYVVNELLWNMNADVDALLDDYHAKMYGPAAKAMRAFADVCEEAFADNSARKSFMAEHHNPIQFNGYTIARIRRADAALAEAAAAAPSGSMEARRVDLIRKMWGAMKLLMENWQIARRIGELDAVEKIVRLVEAGLDRIHAFTEYELSDDDEADIFLDPKKNGFKAWKRQTDSQFAPLVPLEKATDAAFARHAKKLGPAKAKAFFTKLAAEHPRLAPYAETQLVLMQGELPNLIRNGGFEEMHASAKPPKNAAPDWKPLAQKHWAFWKFPSSKAEAWTDETVFHGGTRSVVIGENRQSCCLLTGCGAKPRTRYRVSVWVRRADDNDGKALGSVGIRLKNGKGAWIDNGSAIGCPVPPDAVDKWVELSFVFTTPAREDGVSIEVHLSAPWQRADRRIWFDDVRIEKLCEIK